MVQFNDEACGKFRFHLYVEEKKNLKNMYKTDDGALKPDKFYSLPVFIRLRSFAKQECTLKHFNFRRWHASRWKFVKPKKKNVSDMLKNW